MILNKRQIVYSIRIITSITRYRPSMIRISMSSKSQIQFGNPSVTLYGKPLEILVPDPVVITINFNLVKIYQINN